MSALETLADVLTKHEDCPLCRSGSQRLAENVALDLRRALTDLGLGVDTDGNPDPYSQVGR
jgi:hypothetical protein